MVSNLFAGDAIVSRKIQRDYTQADVVCSHDACQLPCGLHVLWFGAWRRAAVDADLGLALLGRGVLVRNAVLDGRRVACERRDAAAFCSCSHAVAVVRAWCGRKTSRSEFFESRVEKKIKAVGIFGGNCNVWQRSKS